MQKKKSSAVRQHRSGFTETWTGVIINTLNPLDYETVNDSIYDEQCVFTQCLESCGRWMSKGFEVNNAHNRASRFTALIVLPAQHVMRPESQSQAGNGASAGSKKMTNV